MSEDNRALPSELADALHKDPDGASLIRVWDQLGVAQVKPRLDQAEERAATWRAVQAGIEARAQARVVGYRDPAAVAHARRRIGLLAAAALLAVVATGAIVRAAVQERRVTEPGEQARVVLPDGSVVDLAGESSLKWRRGFRTWGKVDDARTVTLEGTAFFEVRRDGRPFVVRTFNAEVQVLGTRFGVRARDGVEGVTAVEVEEGRVALRGTGGREEAQLSAGEQSRLAAGQVAPSAPTMVPVEQIAVWRRGGFAAYDAPLAVILSDLERHYGVRIELRNREAGARHLTLYYPARTPVATILADLCTARGLSFRPTSRGFELE
jgi:transmembrane sensor